MAATHPGQRPMLAVTSDLKGTPVLGDLVSHLHDQKIHAEIVFVTGNDITEAGRGLRARLGFGKP